jgi:hypothetical protein
MDSQISAIALWRNSAVAVQPTGVIGPQKLATAWILHRI